MEPGQGLLARMPTGSTSPLGLIEGHLVTITPRGTVRTLPHPLAMALALLASVPLLITAVVGPASAASYRYWSYWIGTSGTWMPAQTGPGEHVLVDRDVQGWRFGITAEAPVETPENAPDFAALCPDLAAAGSTPGQVRAAVVVDPGFVAAAPEGEVPPAQDSVSCVTLPEGSTGNQALATVASVRDSQGLVCAVNGYPAQECGSSVSDEAAAAAAEAAAAEEANPAPVAADVQSGSAQASGIPWGTAAALALVVVLLAAALLIPRVRGRRVAVADLDDRDLDGDPLEGAR